MDQSIVDMYQDYLEHVTDGNKEAAALLVLSSVRQRMEQVIEGKLPEQGGFGSVDTGEK